MKRAKPLALSLVFFVLLAAGCGARAKNGDPDSETHFLACMSDAECLAGAICQCSQCMVPCASDTTCTGSGTACLAGPTCATSRPVTVCATRCQTDGDCAAGLVCSGDVCTVKSIAAPGDAATSQATPLSFEGFGRAQLAADGQDRLYVLGEGTVQAPPASTMAPYTFLAGFESDGSVRWSRQVDAWASQIAVNAAGEILAIGYDPSAGSPCPHGCAQRRNSAGDVEWTKPGDFEEMLEADGGSFWLLGLDGGLTKWDPSGNELFKQSAPPETIITGSNARYAPHLAPRGSLWWSVNAPLGDAPIADGFVIIERTIAGDLHRIAFPGLRSVSGLAVAADGAVVLPGATTDDMLAVSCREMLGALRWTLSTTVASPDTNSRLSFHRNGNLLVSTYAVGGSTFGGHRVDGDPAVTVGLVAEVDMSSGAVVSLHRLWADPGDTTGPVNPPVVAPLVGLSDGRIAALVGSNAGSAKFFLDDTLVLDGLAAPNNAALVIFKP